MSALWLSICILLLAACALILTSGWRSGKDTSNQRDQLNKTFYRQRLNELDDDEQQGVVAGKQEMIAELQQTLLTDIPEQQPAQQVRTSGRWVLWPGLVVLVLVTLGMYLKTGGLLQVMQWTQIRDEYPALRQRLMDPQGKNLNMQELADFEVGLRTSLLSDPDNINDWAMLGRLGMVLNNVPLSSQAFQRALKLSPDNSDLKLDYAEVLVRSPDPQDNRQAEVMLGDMLRTAPQNLRILSLLAAVSFTEQNYDKAISYWQKMLTLLPADSKEADAVRKGIEQARTNAGQQTSSLTLQVAITPQAEKMLTPDGILYISVTDGVSPVPVAVKRLPLSHFPLTLTLDDSNAMMPERLLSAQHTLQVRVRISRNGSANPQPGDWYGQTGKIHYTGKQTVAVDINQQQP
ncbi:MULTISPECIES: c-type cytochrome biogenesis protein CcmI [unclassified Tatumella]|uniref:c-type cytochrome biogenesis protein CcmI n=1 Tax=unclassified Tatumella TaxID=2649542 RepID=UPI001BAED125|nr:MULTISPECIES: c-type cytochrome biogenesis protein CcmI [unclassified Tatumella]MBS0876397.1 c-type cytochrome biogenesis protein CcmI [Tatumella sp. JGM82]MBS0889570.1 c-type cytochrome biogenesis protein CcmI [Tatumella sp. JGM94]MBS0900692.1 c-type cytochrome biogenesis protein CcmI [Tatumella sp. JGM100]